MRFQSNFWSRTTCGMYWCVMNLAMALYGSRYCIVCFCTYYATRQSSSGSVAGPCPGQPAGAPGRTWNSVCRRESRETVTKHHHANRTTLYCENTAAAATSGFGLTGLCFPILLQVWPGLTKKNHQGLLVWDLLQATGPLCHLTNSVKVLKQHTYTCSLRFNSHFSR